jgi:succinate dehydrogenase / fumarate reductase, cytochrome b subunit
MALTVTLPEHAPAKHRAFWLRRLHSLSGALPLGLFLVSHLWTNLSAVFGQRAFDEKVHAIHALPALGWVEVGAIFLPLLFHAGYGIWISREGRANVGNYPLSGNWAYVFQRITGVVTFAFVCAHLWEYRIQVLLFGMPSASFYPTMAAHLSWTWWGVPWIAIGYLLGSAAAVYHFANGLSGFALSFGLVGSRKAQLRLRGGAMLLGGALYAISAATIVSLATGFGAEANPARPSAAPIPQ